MLCYRYGSVSDQLGPSTFNKFDLNRNIQLSSFLQLSSDQFF